jgi:serine/threonine protein phosphatase 1
MNSGKIFVIGDIHGCLEMLNRLMDIIPWHPEKDRLIFVGDYIDRGEDPKGVVDYILALKDCCPNIDCLIGNHEALFLDYLNGRNEVAYIRNGGWNTLRSYEIEERGEGSSPLPPDHVDFFQSLIPYLELDDYYVVHAGFRPYVSITQQSLRDMVWIRDPFLLSRYDFGKKVIFGHTPFNEPLVMENKIGIDTGAVMGNRLTCLELPEVRFYSVES